MNHEVLARNWWVFVLRGAFALIFGVLAFVVPGAAIFTLVILLTVYLLVDGVFAIVGGIRAAQRHERWWPLILEGVIGIVAGLVALFIPEAAAWALVTLLAVWAILTGVLLIMPVFRPRRPSGAGLWLLALCGVFSVLLGIVMIFDPLLGLLTLAWWVGGYAIAFGVFMLAFGFRLKRERDNPTTPLATGRPA